MGSDWYNFDFLRTRHVLKSVLSVMCLAIGFIAVIGGLQRAAAEDEPAKAANSAARCQALTGLNWAGVEITSARLIPAAQAETVPSLDPFASFESPSPAPTARPACIYPGFED
jgi:hypothetical protein